MQSVPPRTTEQNELDGQPAVRPHAPLSHAGKPPPAIPPRSRVGAYMRDLRLDVALALSLPALCSACAAWWQTGTLRPGALAFTFVSAFAVALSTYLLSAYHDGELAAQAEQRPAAAGWGGTRTLPTTGSLPRAQFSPDLLHSLGLLSLSIAGVCALWAGLLAGWPMVLFLAGSIALVAGYAVPPVRYGARGWGLGEAGLLLALGLLPALAGYYSQAGTLDTLVTWTALPFGLLGAAIVLNSSLIYHRRDWLIRKRTLAVVLGPDRAIDLGLLLVIGAFVIILFGASIAVLPLRTIVALAALPLAAGAYSGLDRDEWTLAQAAGLSAATVNAALATALLFCLALLTHHIW